jgi:hypothetical protein
VSNFLLPIASHWKGEWVACRFKAFADGTPLATTDDTRPLYEIPNGASKVTVTATPTEPAYWDATVTLSVSSNGVVSAETSSSVFVRLRTAVANNSRGTVANIKLSRFKDATTDVLDLLTKPPTTRAGKKVDEPGDHLDLYGAWPPSNWLLPAVPTAHFLDLPTLASTGALTFPETTAPAIDGASVVLRLKGVKPPRLFAVVWPLTLPRDAGADPTPFFLFIRQGAGQNVGTGYFKGGTLDPYPDNFDYADIGLFQNLHYGNAGAPLSTWGPKGVPYQVAKAGANVVTVIPCNGVGPEFGVLNDTEETGKILEEIQAYMFWRAGIPDPPLSIGKTAIAAFSSGNDFLSAWLASEKNRSGSFLKNTVRAVYFLDPRPDAVPGCVTAARTWAQGDQNKRIRLYTHLPDKPEDRAMVRAAHKTLLESQTPAEPYVKNSSDGHRTVSMTRFEDWANVYVDAFSEKFDFDWQYTHHNICATMLTHALAQGDF